MNIPVSDNLRNALRDQGWWALAHRVKVSQELAPPEQVTLGSAVEALSMKISADRDTHNRIREGLRALRLVRGA